MTRTSRGSETQAREDSTFPLTARLAEALAVLSFDDLPVCAIDATKVAFLDTLGVLVAGRREACVLRLEQTLAAMGGQAKNAADLALVGATAAHALDFDDVAFGGHVSAILVPTILAISANRAVSGQDVIMAYVAGYETWAEIATREKTMYHVRGLHPTGLIGAVAAAAAAGVLLKLPTRQMTYALSMGASLGGGLVANFGSMTKPFHAGRAAQAGVIAANLAAQGFDAATDALEAPNGFLASFSPAGETDLIRPLNRDASGDWAIASAKPSVKLYPVCYAGHRSIDAALELRTNRHLDLDELLRIEVTLSARHSQTLRYRSPKSVGEARFSLEFFVAVAFIKGWVGLESLTEAAIVDPDVLVLMAKVSRVVSTDLDPDLDGWSRTDRVVLVYRDGRRCESIPVARPKGHSQLGLEFTKIRHKFEDCLKFGGYPACAADLANAIETLDLQNLVEAPLSLPLLFR